MSLSTMQLNYAELGDPAAKTIVILHGFFASSRNWRQIAKLLAESYHVYVVDLRNHGASPHHPVMDYPSMANDLIAFFDTHQLQKASLLGHSMGGKVAMWFSLRHPDRIEKLIIADIAPVHYRHHFSSTLQALKDLPLHSISNRKQAEELLAPVIADLSLRRFHLQNLVLHEGQYQWKIDLDIFGDNALLIAGFPDVDGIQPYAERVLFVTGGNSNYVLPDYADDIYALFPWAKIHVIADTGHWLHAEKPQVFIHVVENHLG